jgi:hypothetical protein
MVRRQCTREYKIDVVERAIRRELLGLRPRQPAPHDVVVYQYFGISLEEAGRAARAYKRFEGRRWTQPVFPLLEMGWSRTDCRIWLEGRAPNPVPKSACVCCPFRTDKEWAAMKRSDPTGFARAVEIDEALRRDGNIVNRGLDQRLYLHRSCLPLARIDFTQGRDETLHPLTTRECHGVCGT